jgi:hypothetical protein
MKFIRRPDLAPQTRIEIVMTAWLYRTFDTILRFCL